MAYRFIEGLTVADVAFEATGKDFSGLCISAAQAVTNAMVDNPSSIGKGASRTLCLQAETEEKLLHDFLDEIVYFKDADNMVFSGYSIRIGKKEKLVLDAELKGEEIDPEKHKIIVDVKAVSWHKYTVEKTEEGWKAIVILDV